MSDNLFDDRAMVSYHSPVVMSLPLELAEPKDEEDCHEPILPWVAKGPRFHAVFHKLFDANSHLLIGSHGIRLQQDVDIWTIIAHI